MYEGTYINDAVEEDRILSGLAMENLHHKYSHSAKSLHIHQAGIGKHWQLIQTNKVLQAIVSFDV